DAHHLGRAERLSDELERVFTVLHEVDLLVEDIVADGCDADAACSDAAPYRVELGQFAAYRNLGAVAGVAGDGHDLDVAFADFGDLILHQLAQQVVMRAAEDQHGRLAHIAYLDQQALDARAGGRALAGDLLLI